VARNALSATLTVIGLYVGWLLGGTVLVETVFDWPGIGLYATKAIVSQDFMPVHRRDASRSGWSSSCPTSSSIWRTVW
jgi:ABC-type antimicrobial peptide transport system permease subunit